MSTAIIAILNDIAPQFASEPVEKVNRFIGYAQCEINEANFNDQACLNQATAFYTAHLLSKASEDSAIQGSLKRRKEGDLECEYSSYDNNDGSLNSTQYLAKYESMVQDRTITFMIRDCDS